MSRTEVTNPYEIAEDIHAKLRALPWPLTCFLRVTYCTEHIDTFKPQTPELERYAKQHKDAIEFGTYTKAVKPEQIRDDLIAAYAKVRV